MHSHITHRTSYVRCGFTLLELLFALFSLAVLGMAVVGVMTAAADGWEARDYYQEQINGVRTITSRLGQWVRQARRVVGVNTSSGNTDVVLWTDDAYFAGQVNLAEIKVIYYDSDADTLTLYTADMTAAEEAGAANVAFNPLVVGSVGFGAAFRALPSVNAYALARDVVSFTATAGAGMVDSPDYGYLHVRLTVAGLRGAADQAASIGAVVRAPDITVAFSP